MKKQMMTLAVCLALTATSAMAVTSANETAPAAAQKKAAVETKCPCEHNKQNFEEKMAKHIEDFYTKLGLTKEQRKKADYLHEKSMLESESLMAKLFTEKAKVHELRAQKACPEKVAAQVAKVKEAKQALRTHMECSKKEFEAILNKQQLAKLKALKEEKKEQFRKCKCHGHGHGHMQHPGFGTDEEGCQPPFEPECDCPAPKCPCGK